MATSPEPGRSVDASEAMRLVEAGDMWLLDVREPFEWQGGHAPRAHHIPMGDLGRRQNELPADGVVIGVICHSGQRSRMVADALADADYPAVNVDGGMIAWQSSGGQVVSGASSWSDPVD